LLLQLPALRCLTEAFFALVPVRCRRIRRVIWPLLRPPGGPRGPDLSASGQYLVFWSTDDLLDDAIQTGGIYVIDMIDPLGPIARVDISTVDPSRTFGGIDPRISGDGTSIVWILNSTTWCRTMTTAVGTFSTRAILCTRGYSSPASKIETLESARVAHVFPRGKDAFEARGITSVISFMSTRPAQAAGAADNATGRQSAAT
jgi:hypothetical protein